MEVIKTKLEGVLIIKPRVFGDNRGWFYECYSKKAYTEAGITCEFVQDNQSLSSQKGIIRGLHFQTAPHTQAKLVRCSRGAVLDVAVDLRKDSPTYKQWISVELSEENKTQLFIPKGFAHGFVTLTENCELQYKCDDFYAPECDGGIPWDEKEIGVEWGVENPVLSEKDKKHPPLAEQDIQFNL